IPHTRFLCWLLRGPRIIPGSRLERCRLCREFCRQPLLHILEWNSEVEIRHRRTDPVIPCYRQRRHNIRRKLRWESLCNSSEWTTQMEVRHCGHCCLDRKSTRLNSSHVAISYA